MLVNVAGISEGLTGFTAQKCLEDCGIVVDKIPLPYADSTPDNDIRGQASSQQDNKPDATTGIRLGTPIVTRNGMGFAEMDRIVGMIDAVLKKIQPVGECQYAIDESFATDTKKQVTALARRFPVW